MKPNLVVCLFLLSSCALYQEIIGPARKTEVSVTPQAVKETKTEIETDIQSDVKNVRSTDGAATLVLDPGNIRVALKTNTMSYREGHSVEVKTIPGTTSILRVLPTDSNIVQFADSAKVTNLIQGKKSVEIELYLDDSGLKVFTFNL